MVGSERQPAAQQRGLRVGLRSSRFPDIDRRDRSGARRPGVSMSHLLTPHIGETLPTIARAEGSWVWDTAGRRYLDGSSGAVVVSLGHAHPEVLQTMREQAQLVSYVVRGHFTSEAAERLASRLVELAPGDLDSVFLVNSGSEAVEAAVRLALQHWSERGQPGKRWLVSRRGSYHGTTLGALSLSGHPVRRRHSEPLLHPFPAV